MTVCIVFLIIFLLSFKIEFRQYKNVYFLAIIFMSVLISIFVNIIIPSFELNMNVNYLLILNMFYGVLGTTNKTKKPFTEVSIFKGESLLKWIENRGEMDMSNVSTLGKF